MKNQSGLSLVELLVATALLGLIVYSGMSLINVPNGMRSKELAKNDKTEQYREAFNAFYRVYNKLGSSTSNAGLIEALNTVPVPIRYSSSATELTIAADNSYIEIGGGSSALNNLLMFRVISQPGESQSLCRLTTSASGTTTWNYSCPGGSYNGFRDAFQNNQITELPILLIDGRICYVTQIDTPTSNTVTIDTSRNDCLTPQRSDYSSDFSGMFTLPRMVVFSSDKTFSQPIFESFYQPRDRFGTNYYPCLLYTSPSPRDRQKSRMPSSA